MKKKLREALERLEEVGSDGDQDEIDDAVAELAGVLDDDQDGSPSLADALRKRHLEEAAELAERLEEELENAPSDGEEAEEAEELLRELAMELYELLKDEL
jgi:hypothetical protein